MEKFSSYRDAGTGILPFTFPLPPATEVPAVLAALSLPFSALLGGVRLLIVTILLGIYFLFTKILFLPFAPVPPVHHVLVKALGFFLLRPILLLLGFWSISTESAPIRRGVKLPDLPFAPRKGDIIFSNWSSYLDVIVLQVLYNPVFLLPVSSTGSKASSTSSAKITGWRSVGLFSALAATGRVPERSERGVSLQQAVKDASRPVVVFPECTSSNNRGLLKFAELYDHPVKAGVVTAKTFVLTFKYETPTSLASSPTHPIPSPVLNPLVALFWLCTSPVLRTLVVRQAHPSESPKISVPPTAAEWESIAAAMSQSSKLKRVGLGWESKQAFFDFRKGGQSKKAR